VSRDVSGEVEAVVVLADVRAKDAARRSGKVLNDWISGVIIDALRAQPDRPSTAGGERDQLREALRLAECGADKAGCDGWQAQEMCRQIVPLLTKALAALSDSGRAGE
jgi:hypothetical protein